MWKREEKLFESTQEHHNECIAEGGGGVLTVTGNDSDTGSHGSMVALVTGNNSDSFVMMMSICSSDHNSAECNRDNDSALMVIVVVILTRDDHTNLYMKVVRGSWQV